MTALSARSQHIHKVFPLLSSDRLIHSWFINLVASTWRGENAQSPQYINGCYCTRLHFKERFRNLWAIAVPLDTRGAAIACASCRNLRQAVLRQLSGSLQYSCRPSVACRCPLIAADRQWPVVARFELFWNVDVVETEIATSSLAVHINHNSDGTHFLSYAAWRAT
jgi:hypothetical protein